MPMVVKGLRRFVGETSLVFQHNLIVVQVLERISNLVAGKAMISGSPKSFQDDSVY
jgi:ABC-type branched-subunit amino acid transport system ATPase component